MFIFYISHFIHHSFSQPAASPLSIHNASAYHPKMSMNFRLRVSRASIGMVYSMCTSFPSILMCSHPPGCLAGLIPNPIGEYGILDPISHFLMLSLPFSAVFGPSSMFCTSLHTDNLSAWLPHPSTSLLYHMFVPAGEVGNFGLFWGYADTFCFFSC